MAMKILTADEIARRTATSGPVAELAGQLSQLKPGMGGVLSVSEERTSRQTLKNRIQKASQVSGVPIKFVRSGAEEVVFQVVEAGASTRRRGRPPKIS